MMVLLSLGIAPWAKAQTFDKLWKQVEQAEQKSLPQTVIQLTDRIYKKAETERNISTDVEGVYVADEIPRNVDSR